MNDIHHRDLTDAEWARLQPLLPPQKPKTGRPALPHRTLINAILWVHDTGGPWRCLPREYGSWSTAASRYHRWKKAGIWQRVAQALAVERAVTGNGADPKASVGVAAPAPVQVDVPAAVALEPVAPPARDFAFMVR
jgi:transposase